MLIGGLFRDVCVVRFVFRNELLLKFHSINKVGPKVENFVLSPARFSC